jgi:hypothetical protein
MDEEGFTSNEELTAFDYMNRSVLELMSHPDYSELAMRKIAHICTMTSAQLESLNLNWE